MAEPTGLASAWPSFVSKVHASLTQWLGPSAAEWVIAATVLLVLPTILLFVRRRLIALIDRAETGVSSNAFFIVSQLARRVRKWFIFVLTIWAAMLLAPVAAKLQVIVDKVFIVCAFAQLAILSIWILDWGVNNVIAKTTSNRGGDTNAPSPNTRVSQALFHFLVRIVVVVALILSMLDNLGIEIKTLIAGLGIGGIAVALAVQNVLGDLLASLSIALDQPFEVGDVINVGPDHVGTVEKIGVKTTRLRSNSGEQIIVSNNDLLQARIRNFKRMQERRVVFKIGVTYGTPLDKLQSIKQIVKELVEVSGQTRLERVHLATLASSSIDFEVAYFMLTADYNQYMDVQEQVNLGLLKRFAEQGIEFAYPTQTVFNK